MPPLLLINLACAGYLTGLIWLVQVVQYPGFALAAPGDFPAYHAAHVQRITWVVGPPMLLEAAAAVGLALQPGAVPRPAAWALLALVGAAWITTAGWSVPAHERLSAGFDPDAWARLVRTNWVRTVAWSARLAVLAWLALTLPGRPGPG